MKLLADLGVNANGVPPKDPALAALHAEEQYHECRARIARLKKTILGLEHDIEGKQREVQRGRDEIVRLEAHLKTVPYHEEATSDG